MHGTGEAVDNAAQRSTRNWPRYRHIQFSTIKPVLCTVIGEVGSMSGGEDHRADGLWLQSFGAGWGQCRRAAQSGRDPRLSEAGNHVWKRVGLLLDVLGHMEVWLARRGRAALTAENRAIRGRVLKICCVTPPRWGGAEPNLINEMKPVA
jgi:hypothetical protein